MLLRAEAWTLPTSASFEKITDVPMLAGSSGSRELSSYSDNTLIVASTWDRFDDIRKSLIRIFDGDTVIDEHEVKRIAKSPKRPTQFQVSGPQANGLVEKLLIYPRTDSVDAQDWIWGGENQLPPLGLGDLNNVNEEWHLYSDATSGTMTLTVDGQTTTTFAYNTSDPASIENRIQALSNINDVTVNGDGTEASPWVIIFYDPPDPTTVTVDDSGLSGGTATLTKEQEGGLDASPITQSQHADQRVDVAEHGTYGNPPIIPITQSNLDTDATWALQVNAEGQFAGSQIVISVNPGQTYQAHIRVKPSVAGKYRLVIRDLAENLIKATSPFEVSLSAGSYQDLSISDIVIPGGVTEVIMRVAVVSSAPSEIGTFWVNWEAARFDEGMAATTFTEIVRLLIEDAQERGAYEFLDLDFNDTEDTASNVLEDESFTAFAFSNLGHVMADGSDLGYKWRIRPKATPAGALTHDLQVYLEGEVEDLTASSGGPTVQTGSVDDAAVVSRSPDFTVAVGWGAEGLYAEVEDAALVAEYGRIERVFDAEHLSSVASLERMLDEKFREQAENEDALSAEVPGDAQRVPLVDYAEGSKIWWAFPDEGVEKVAKTVRRVSWTHSDTASFTLQASEVLSEQAGMARAMHHLLRKFERRRRRERRSITLGGRGGTPTIVVAASDATNESKGKADFVCSGTNDEAVIQVAIDQITAQLDASSADSGGRVLLTEGTFNITVPAGQAIDVAARVTVEGINPSATVVRIMTNSGSGRYVFRLGNGAEVRTLSIQRNSGITLTTSTPHGILLSGNDTKVIGCQFVQIGGVGDGTGASVWVFDCENAVVTGCEWDQTEGDALLINSCVVAFADDNRFRDVQGRGVYAISSDSVHVRGNEFSSQMEGVAIHLDTCTKGEVSGNTLQDSQDSFIVIEDSTRCSVTDNIGYQIGDHGVHLNGSSLCIVADNILHSPGWWSGTGDGVNVAGGNNQVEGNHIRPEGTGGGNGSRYGVNVVSGTGSIVVGNSLGTPGDWDSDALNDSGTSTVLTYPGHATYGDNFTA